MLHPKVQATVSAASLTTALVAVLSLVNVDVPSTVSAALVTVLSFAAGYLKKA